MKDKFKEFFNSNTGKAVLGIIAMVIAGVVTAKIINNSQEK
jgi:NhaP-type Na+/H+ or K+/H+ antiporter